MKSKSGKLNKMRVLRLSIATIAIGLFAAFNSAALHASQAVTVYQHINFGGSSLSVGAGDVTIGDLQSSGVRNDRISSIRVSAGYEVLACQHSQLGGRCELFTSDITDLRTISFNDTISSLRVSLSAASSPVRSTRMSTLTVDH